jgi:fluoroquinolone transport system permease protein
MTNILKTFFGSFTLIRRDPLLIILVLGPFLYGPVFRFCLPMLQPVLMNAFSFDLTPWYLLADMLLLTLTPMLAGMLCGFLMLDERDEGLGEYYSVTPLGGAGYIASRLALPVLWSIVIAPVLMMLFSLTHPEMLRVLCIAVTGGLFGAVNTLMLLSFANNKVEGLAVSKIMGLTMLPMIVPIITNSPWGLIAGVFPAYWLGALLQGPLWLFPVALAVSIVWMVLFYKRIIK